MSLNQILDQNPIEIKRIGKTLWTLHALEIIAFALFLLGGLEKIEHTQYIPGISLIFWSLLFEVLIIFLIAIFYEIRFPPKNRINYSFALGFASTIAINSLGLIERLEHTQFVPGIAMSYLGNMMILVLIFSLVIIHEIRKKSSFKFFIPAFIFGLISTIIMLRKTEDILHFRFSDSINIPDPFYFLPLILIYLIYMIFRKSYFKKYFYHYIRILILFILGI